MYASPPLFLHLLRTYTYNSWPCTDSSSTRLQSQRLSGFNFASFKYSIGESKMCFSNSKQ
ncbi:hypothetical protein TMatcc_003821 [Talaromyces marneffei ATCC 18224]